MSAFCGLVTPVLAAEWFVAPAGNDSATGLLADPVATIKRGIQLSSDGDTVWVQPGDYSGIGNRELSLMGKRIIVRSVSGPTATTINCGGLQAFVASSGETRQTVIDGFTITNGFKSNGRDWTGYGVLHMENCALTIRNCIFHGNSAQATYSTSDAGIVLKHRGWSEAALIENCLFYNNTVSGIGQAPGIGFGTGFMAGGADNGPIDIKNCTFADNTLLQGSTGGGGALRIAQAMGGTISNCIEYFNSPPALFTHTLYARTIPVQYSLAAYEAELPDGIGMIIGVDPSFTNRAAANYKLAAGSPAIDSGDPDQTDPDGSRLDIGYRADRFVGYDSDNLTFNLSLTTTGSGSVSGSGSYESGGTAVLTAIPNPGYLFTGWTGDASGTDNPLSVLMESDKTIGATFEPDFADSDFDGLSNHDEIVIHGTNPNNADTDGDGVPDGLEVKERTNPLDATKFNSFSKGMVAYLPFDNGPKDLSGYNRSISTLSNPTFISDQYGGYAAQFDGIDDAFVFSNDSDLPMYRSDWGNPPASLNQGPVSISVWIRRYPGGEQDQCVFGKRDYTSFNLVLRDGKFTGEARWPGVQPDPVVVNNQSEVPDQNWHHVVYVWDEPVFRIYVDGVLSSELNAPNITELASVSMPWVIGAKSDIIPARVEFFKGALDNLRLYSRALSGKEIASLHTVEQSKFQIILGNYTWHEAKADAETRGGRLAVLDTHDKINVVTALLGNASTWPMLWIGLTDELVEGDWRWIDGSVPTATKWASGEPDSNGGKNEDGAAIFSSDHGLWPRYWGDAEQWQTFGYVLETSSLTFNLSLTTTGSGSVSGSGSYESGGTAVLTAIPNPGYVFTGWTGDASGTDNPLSVLMESDKTIGATFEQDLADDDDDGLTNYQEIVIYGSNPNKSDTTGDGLTDGELVTAGLSPVQDYSYILSKAAQQLVDARPGSMVIRANGDLTVTLELQMERSVNLIDWTADPSDKVQTTLPMLEGKQFFRFGIPSK